MCWWSRKEPVKKVAEKDIPVFKVLFKKPDNSLVSYYMDFKYTRGVVYSNANMKVLINQFAGSYNILEGYHSYFNSCSISYWDEGIQIYTSKDTLGFYPKKYREDKVVVAKCIIPKGSEYYVNEFEMCVSNQIKIEDVLEK